MVELVLLSKDMAAMALQAPVLSVLVSLCNLATPFLKIF
jgi:hypothetical protein